MLDKEVREQIVNYLKKQIIDKNLIEPTATIMMPITRELINKEILRDRAANQRHWGNQFTNLLTRLATRRKDHDTPEKKARSLFIGVAKIKEAMLDEATRYDNNIKQGNAS